MSGPEVLIGLSWAAMTAWGGYLVGQWREWSRVLRYLYQHEDKTASWITTGIVMDDHHKRHRKAPTQEDPK